MNNEQGVKRFQEGETLSSHGCYIPHEKEFAPTISSTHIMTIRRDLINKTSVFIKLLNGSVIRLPANFAHYIDPRAHKEYARLMPSKDFAEWAVSQEYLEFLPITGRDDAISYGYTSYVKKDGVLLCGIYGGSSFARYVGREISYQQYAGSLVMTKGDDEHVIDKAPIQKQEYSLLCETVARRFAFLKDLYRFVECYGKVNWSSYHRDHFSDLLNELRPIVGSPDKYTSFAQNLMSLIENYQFDKGKTFNLAMPSGKNYELTECEILLLFACVSSNYYDGLESIEIQHGVKFKPCSEEVLKQFKAYEAECASPSGYQSPVFRRQQNKEQGYDTDDDRKYQNPKFIR